MKILKSLTFTHNSTPITSQSGSGLNDVYYLLSLFVGNSHSSFIGIDNDENIYNFEIMHNLNNQIVKINVPHDELQYYARYLGNGAQVLAICVQLIKITNKLGIELENIHKNVNLVLKLLFYKKRETNYIQEYSNNINITYSRYKNILSNALINIYFSGDKVNKIYPTEYRRINNHNLLDETLLTHNIGFTICKYYDHNEDITQIIDKIILKSILIVHQIILNNHIATDLKQENTVIGSNITLIDFDISLLTLIKTNNKLILFNKPWFSRLCSCYFKKIMYLKLGLDNSYNRDISQYYIDKYIQLDNIEFGKLQPYNKSSYMSDKYLMNLLYNISNTGLSTDQRKIYYYINFDPKFIYFNIIFVCEIIIYLLFQPFEFKKLFNSEGTYYNKINFEYLYAALNSHISSFQNLNDIDFIIRLIYGNKQIYVDSPPTYINPILQLKSQLEISPTIINGLKKLLFDIITDTGLLAPTFYNMPPFILILKYLMNLFYQIIDDFMYNIFLEYLIENVGSEQIMSKTVEQLKEDFLKQLEDLSPREISKITTINGLELTIADYNDLPDKSQFIITQFTIEEKRQLTYEKWSDTRHLLQLTEDPYFRSDEEIMLPPVNSKFKQNEFLLFNGYRIYKWIFNDIKQPIINPFWVQLLTILGLISPFIIESNTVYNLNITQLNLLNDYLGVTVNKFTLDEAIVIILPTQITLRIDQPYHPFIIKHSGERHIEDVNLPIDTSHTFTLEYCRKVFRQIKGPIYIKLKNTRNEEMLKRLKQELDQPKYKQKLDKKFHPVELGLKDKSPKYPLSKTPIISIGRMKKKFRKGKQNSLTDRNSEKIDSKKKEQERKAQREYKERFKQEQFYNKYLKYKTKYLKLKSMLNIF